MFIPYFKRLVHDPVCIGRVKLLELRRPFQFLIAPKYYIPNSWRETHVHCIGLTGSGKSTLLKSLFVQDVLANRGCALIDPDEDLATGTLRQLLSFGYFGKITKHDRDGKPIYQWNEEALKRVVYFEPARQTDWVIPFNILNNPSFQPDELAGHITEAFTRAWSTIKEAPRFVSVAFPALLLLIQAGKTLPDLYSLLEDPGFRIQVLQTTQDKQLVKLFLNEFNLWHETQANNNESVTNKLTLHIFNSKVRRCMGLPINNINATSMMDEGKVLIVNLRGLSDPVQRMFGSLITVLFEQAALNRPEGSGRRVFNYYLDEFTDYCANEGSATSLARILSRCRKRNFRAHLFHQTLGQLQGTLGSALDNVGLFLSFVIGHEDSGEMIHKIKTRSQDWMEDRSLMQELQPHHLWMRRRGSKRIIPLITDPPIHDNVSNEALEALIQQLEQRHGIKTQAHNQPLTPQPRANNRPTKDWTPA